jgi:hypothetical protein
MFRTEFPEYEIWAYIHKRNNLTDHVYDSSAGLPIDQPLLYSLTMSGTLLSNLVMAGYQSTSGKADAALRLISARSAAQLETSPHLYLCLPCTTWRGHFITQL